ncbi:MAG TPA: ABC transporter ATP-binding protein [Ktedonobacterales bacterium]|nr:ABC transporter ATP-binding protein [Ktedonobacterales bacterium]
MSILHPFSKSSVDKTGQNGSRKPAKNKANQDTPILEALHIRKEFPLGGLKLFGPRRGVKAVEDVSLALRPGRSLAVVGESGSGKTTIARLLAQLYPVSSGSIRFRGAAVRGTRGRKARAYRRHVQLIFQDPFSSLNPMHTIRYHLSRPLRIHGHARSAAQVERQVKALLERVNLVPAEQYIDKFPHQLSGGQRQRVAIARALAAQPEVLLADEPVSMLDVSIRLDILNLLLRLKEEDRLALLYITHDIASARYFADETLVMYAGQVVEGGPSEEVIQQPKHPYTQLLLLSAPAPEQAEEQHRADSPLLATRGDPPSLIDPPKGCRFHPRCPYAMPICREQVPPRTDLGAGHWTHCFLYGETTRLGDLKPARPTKVASEE